MALTSPRVLALPAHTLGLGIPLWLGLRAALAGYDGALSERRADEAAGAADGFAQELAT